MAILQVRDLDDRLYNSLKTLARRENRSLSQEVISILEIYLSNPSVFNKNSTKEFLSLSGAWDDVRESHEIIRDIRKNRIKSKRFKVNNGIFN
jgi:hypothetical protein